MAQEHPFGFSIPDWMIEPQGDRTHREYLDYLVSLSKLTLPEFENRYRMNLARTDMDMSNPVQQNIDTLQRFFHR